MYGLINEVPENIKFFCTACCAVISTILEVNTKLNNLDGKFCKNLEDIQTRLSDQIKALELKLKKFKVVDKITDQIKKLESKMKGFKMANQLSDQIKEMEAKLHKPIEQHQKV